MRASVVIPTVNEVTLIKALEAVTCQTRTPDEIVVVGCVTKKQIRAYPMVRFIDTGQAVCAAAARNIGIQASTGDIIAFTDADCIPAPDWLERHLEAQLTGKSVVGGGVSPQGSTFWAQADNVSMFHAYLSANKPGIRVLLPTLNLSVRRGVIDQIGYMDESFPGAAAEDTDWTMRMRLAGHTLHFQPRAVVHHSPGRTRWRDFTRHARQLGYSAIRTRLRYAQEFGTPRLAKSALLWRTLSPAIAALVTVRIYTNPIMWRHLLYLPVVYLGKFYYCLGAAASLQSGYAFDETRILPEPARP